MTSPTSRPALAAGPSGLICFHAQRALLKHGRKAGIRFAARRPGAEDLAIADALDVLPGLLQPRAEDAAELALGDLNAHQLAARIDQRAAGNPVVLLQVDPDGAAKQPADLRDVRIGAAEFLDLPRAASGPDRPGSAADRRGRAARSSDTARPGRS